MKTVDERERERERVVGEGKEGGVDLRKSASCLAQTMTVVIS